MPDGGTIILTGSGVSIKGYPATSVYATKAAIRSFARTWTTDLKDRGIRVNVVSPGHTDTALLSRITACDPKSCRKIRLAVPTGAPGHPEEIAKAVAFLASDDASFIDR